MTVTTTAYLPLCMTGRCFNGAQRDQGQLFHAVAENKGWNAALCGAMPGLRGNGWSDRVGKVVTCPRCIKRMVK